MQKLNKQINLSKFISNLPEDLQNIIISYTYNIQNSDLLQDIKSYQESKDIISKIYYNRNKDLLEYEINADKHWLVSDLVTYMKVYNLPHYKACLSIDIKSFKIQIKNKMSVEKKVNKFWSLLTPNQREIFIQIRKPKNETI